MGLQHPENELLVVRKVVLVNGHDAAWMTGPDLI